MALFLATACGASSQISQVRFANRPPVWRVNDRNDVPEKPANREYARTLYHVDGYVVRRLSRILEFNPTRRAANVNSLDEVPDSTWFTNRIGVREITVDEIRRGPNENEGPELHKPWLITGTKVGGLSTGFLMKDARGIKYLLKFDTQAFPELETAADVILQRILWACGYNVPEDSIVEFERKDLVLADDAVKKDTFGNKFKMTVKDLEYGLDRVFISPDGRIRGLASKYLRGIPIAGYPREGVRKDDPNDIIPHERRRELRGQIAIFAWLAHTDLQEDNTLDAWEADPDNPDKHYVVHYLIDFGKALGVMAMHNDNLTVGYTHLVDFSYTFRSIFTLGLWKRPWEGQRAPKILGVGLWESERYNPGVWKANSPYWPYKDADRFDAFWGAKIIIRFTPELLRAAVEEGKYSDPRATEYVTRVLIERQRKTARYWFRQVNPLDQFEIRKNGGAHELCFDDLMLKYELEDKAAVTQYAADLYDYDGNAVGFSQSIQGTASGRGCVRGFGPADPTHEGYTIVRLVTTRGKETLPPVLVHLAIDPATSALRVIGIRRQ